MFSIASGSGIYQGHEERGAEGLKIVGAVIAGYILGSICYVMFSVLFFILRRWKAFL